MVKIPKKGALELSVGAVVILILAIILLGLGIGFIKGMFGKTTVKFEELVLREPEPPAPTSSSPITLSREIVTANAGETEALKISVFNPTNKDWTFRDALLEGATRCGYSGDNICYVNSQDTSGKCVTLDNAKIYDNECTGTVTCGDEDPPGPGEGECIIDNINCPEGDDPDCAPNEGVRLAIECSQELDLEIQTNPKEIISGESATFTALLEIKKGIPKKTYLCQIQVLGEGAGLSIKELIVRVS